jgi:hypothetical protein
MASLRFGPRARSSRPLATRAASPRDDGAYLTDGRRLFRVVGPLCCLERPDMAVLEGCRTLCLTAFTSDELSAMQLAAITRRSRSSPSGCL